MTFSQGPHVLDFTVTERLTFFWSSKRHAGELVLDEGWAEANELSLHLIRPQVLGQVARRTTTNVFPTWAVSLVSNDRYWSIFAFNKLVSSIYCALSRFGMAIHDTWNHEECVKLDVAAIYNDFMENLRLLPNLDPHDHGHLHANFGQFLSASDAGYYSYLKRDYIVLHYLKM